MKKLLLIFVLGITCFVYADIKKDEALNILKQKKVFYAEKRGYIGSKNDGKFTDEDMQEEMVIIAAPATEAAAIETRLELFFDLDFEEKA